MAVQNLITKAQLVDQNFKIVKKFVMIDSRVYEEDAFKYVLDLADKAGALVFVYNTKKIWANGQYFGGDILSDELKYFTTIQVVNNDGSWDNIIATDRNDAMQIIGKGFVNVVGNKSEKSISVNYDLNSAVNSEYVEINGDRYSLVVDNDGRLRLDKYSPVTLSISNLPALEYDRYDGTGYINPGTDDAQLVQTQKIEFTISVSSSKPLKYFGVRTVPNLEIQQNETNGNKISVKIPVNTDVPITAYADDEVTTIEKTVIQKWGYGIWYGVTNYLDDYFENANTDIINLEEMTSISPNYIYTGGSASLNVTIEQESGFYAYLICPDNLELEFTDASTNLTGGWRPYYNMTMSKYSLEKTYTIYRTDHHSLGSIKWKITLKD